jgi:hypothetical protein
MKHTIRSLPLLLTLLSGLLLANAAQAKRPEVLQRAADWWLSVRGTENTFCARK